MGRGIFACVKVQTRPTPDVGWYVPGLRPEQAGGLPEGGRGRREADPRKEGCLIRMHPEGMPEFGCGPGDLRPLAGSSSSCRGDPVVCDHRPPSANPAGWILASQGNLLARTDGRDMKNETLPPT